MAESPVSKHQTRSADERSSKSHAGRSAQKCSSIHFALPKSPANLSCVLQIKTEVAGYIHHRRRRSVCRAKSLATSRHSTFAPVKKTDGD
jgi:hypothetical protein